MRVRDSRTQIGGDDGDQRDPREENKKEKKYRDNADVYVLPCCFVLIVSKSFL